MRPLIAITLENLADDQRRGRVDLKARTDGGGVAVGVKARGVLILYQAIAVRPAAGPVPFECLAGEPAVPRLGLLPVPASESKSSGVVAVPRHKP